MSKIEVTVSFPINIERLDAGGYVATAPTLRGFLAARMSLEELEESLPGTLREFFEALGLNMDCIAIPALKETAR